MIELTTPLSKETLRQLKAGDEISLSGVIYTGRDAAHKRLVELLEKHHPLPFDVRDQVIYYVGPTPSKQGEVFGSGGPTTSGRMDAYAPILMQEGLRAMIGKGYRNEHVKQAMKDHTGVYFGALGGAGAYIGECVVASEIIAFEDLGAEAIRRLVVKELPLTVVIDAFGNDLYELGRKDYLEHFKK